MRRTALWILLAVLAGCASPTGTGSNEDQTTLPDVTDFDLALGTAPLDVSGVTENEISAVVNGDTAFALDLLRALATGDNTIISPFSIATALGMLEPGARGATRAEMASVLHETLGDDRLHQARGALLASINAPAAIEGAEPFTLRAVNAAWFQKDYPFLSAYLDTLSGSYGAGAFLLDFSSQPEPSRRVINAWVADQTEQRITDLIPEGVITDLTRLVLTNAVYFKATWVNQFDPTLTEDGIFTTEAGEAVTVPFMHSSSTIGYVEGQGFSAAWLPYWGDASMMVILPDGDVARLIESITVEDLMAARDRRTRYQVDLALPSFEFRSELLLVDTLKDLGMISAFDPQAADLTGIVENPDLYVQNVVHQGFIKVDEEGTEAAAATAIVAGITSMPPRAELKLDRPFLFLIQQESTGEILFAGVVANPSAGA